MTERLTEYDSHGDLYVKNHDYISASHKLAQYEDLGFTPEEVALLAKFYKEHTSVSSITTDMKLLANSIKWEEYEKLKEQGRLIELPCEVGDTVYEILPPCDDTLLCETFQKFFISRCVNKECGHYIQIKQFRIELLEKFGNTVFLTKEEAEAKLKELRGEQE